MSFSLFSNKKTPDQEKTALGIKISPAVQTMRNDLEYLKNHHEGTSVSSGKSKEETKEKPTQTSVKPAINPFSKEGEKAFQEEMNKKADVHAWATPSSKVTILGKPLVQKDIKKNPLPTVLKTLPGSQLSQKKRNPLLVIGIGVVALGLIFGGAYYYFFVVKKSVVPEVVPEQITEPAPVESIVVPTNEPIYALDKPNYLSVNTEVVSPEEIQKTLSAVASRIKEAGISQPVEFLVTDQNNNPLAFSRFALLLQVGLASTVLSQVDESFSLYVYNDTGDMRIGLGLGLKNQKLIVPALLKVENTLPDAFQKLLLEPNVTVPKTIVFKPNVFVRELPAVDQAGVQKTEYQLRYANIDTERKMSIDYAIVGSRWYIGTSRNTLTALLSTIVK